MPTSAAVQEQLTDIVVRVLGCPADAVVPEAVLKELGADSLTVVEIGEELGRRFDVHLSDDAIDSLVTVKDAVRAVVHHDGTPQPAASLSSAAIPAAATPERRRELAKRRSRTRTAALWLGLVGVVIGAVLGLGGAALVSASGLDSVDLPPLTMPTTETTTPKPSPSATTPAPADENAVPDPTLVAASSHVSPGEHFGLSGAFPELGKGAKLQVQVKDKGSDWDDFPVDTTTKDDGKFETEIYTSRTGTRKFRMFHKKTGKATPAVTVEIG